MMSKKEFVARLFRFLKYRRVKQATDKEYKSMSANVEMKKLTNRQKAEAKAYWKQMLGVNIDTKWHQLAYSITGVFDKRLIPNDIYVGYIQPALINYRIKLAYDDKNVFPKLLPFANHPKKILQCENGLFYTGEKKILSREQAIALCQNIEKALIKPTIATNSGRNVCMFSVKNGMTNIDGLTVDKLFDRYGINFLIDEFVKQHPDMARLNPSSLNTLRVVTFRNEDKVYVCHASCRIGKPGNVVDNFAQGGMECEIDENGRLVEYAYTKVYSDRRTTTHTGVVLKGFQIPGFDKVKEFVTQAMYAIPQFNVLGFDIAIDENAEPVFIEYNTNFSNNAFLESGLLYGKYTDEVLRFVKKEYERKLKQGIYIC